MERLNESCIEMNERDKRDWMRDIGRERGWTGDSLGPFGSPRTDSVGQRCQETVSQGKTSSVSQRCQIDRSTLKPSSFPSVKAKYRKFSVRQGVKVPSPDIIYTKT